VSVEYGGKGILRQETNAQIFASAARTLALNCEDWQIGRLKPSQNAAPDAGFPPYAPCANPAICQQE